MGVLLVSSPVFFIRMEIAIIPKWLIRYVSLNEKIQYEANILISNLLIISMFIAFSDSLLVIANALPHFCLFDKITGVQCPVCGITRAFCELSKGNIMQACKLNVASLFVVSFFAFQVPLRICSIYKPETQKTVTEISKIFSRLVVVVIVVNWLINLIVRYF